MPRIRFLSALAAALFSAVPARAQETRPGPAAEAVARAAFRAMEERRWGDVAPLMHPEALRRFRTQEVRSARTMDRMDPAAHRDPEMPEAVAQWLEERTRRNEATGGSILERQFGVRTSAELEALTEEELFARWLRMRDPAEMMLRELQARGQPVPMDSVAAFAPRRVRTVIGSVVQDDSTVLVVYGPAMQMDGDRQPEHPAIVTVRRTPAGWRLWSGERDHGFLGESSFSLGFEVVDEERLLAEAKDNVVSWPAGAVPAGRAFVAGYPGGTRPPRALVVEVAGANGAPARVEIPASVFEQVMEELLMPWIGLEEEPPQAPARP